MSEMMTLAQAALWMDQSKLVGNPQLRPIRVHTDTRTIEPGDLFFALKGDRYDANDFLGEAMARGAIAVVCSSGLQTHQYPPGLSRIEVADTRLALQALATSWRRSFSLPVIGVTGSNGKTTVTQMVASILNTWCSDGQALATLGNLNNEIGVPLTVLRLRSTHRIAVVELGMNHPGEIAGLAAVSQPTVALVNNAQREHLEFMHTVGAVAEENGAVLASLPADGVAVFPADDSYAPLWKGLAGNRRCINFATKVAEDDAVLVCTQAIWNQNAWQIQVQGMGVTLHYRLAIAGQHNVKNSLAAAACAIAAGVPVSDIEKGLSAFTPVKGRSKAFVRTVADRTFTLVDDTYNANPDSVRAAIDVLAGLPAPQLLVLGDMGEVGNQGPQFHEEAGRYAKERGISTLYATGKLAKSSSEAFQGGQHFETVEMICDSMDHVLPAFQSVLVKGSRFMRMERIVESVLKQFDKGAH